MATRRHYRTAEVAFVRRLDIKPLRSREIVGRMLGMQRQTVKNVEEKALYTIIKRLREELAFLNYEKR